MSRRRRRVSPLLRVSRRKGLGFSPGVHEEYTRGLVREAERMIDNAEKATQCTAAIENLEAAVYLAGKAKANAEASGSEEALRSTTRLMSHLDRISMDTISKKCTRKMR